MTGDKFPLIDNQYPLIRDKLLLMEGQYSLTGDKYFLTENQYSLIGDKPPPLTESQCPLTENK